MADPLIELREVSLAFGQHVILDGVNLTIHRGEAIAILGPSGTGKSTILRVICGLQAPDRGEIYVQGKLRQGTIEDADDPVGIAMVFQQAALFDSLTVEQNVGFLLYRHSRLPANEIRELVDQKLELVGLPGIGDLYPAELSGGMRKRVSLARSIIFNPENPEDTPELLLYDEPTAGLDPIASTVIEDVIRQLHGVEGGYSTYAVVTHQDSTIRRTTDRIIFLYQGKLQWDGSREEAYSSDNPMLRQFFSGSIKGPIQTAD